MINDNILSKGGRQELKNSCDFNDALSIVLLEQGISVVVDATVYIRSLEGEFWCVGTYDDQGGINFEKEFPNDIGGAIEFFHRLREDNDLV